MSAAKRYIIPGAILLVAWIAIVVSLGYPGWYSVEDATIGLFRICLSAGGDSFCTSPGSEGSFNSCRMASAAFLVIATLFYTVLIAFCAIKFFGVVGDVTENGIPSKIIYLGIPIAAVASHLIGVIPFSAHDAIPSSHLFVSFYMCLISLFLAGGALFLFCRPKFNPKAYEYA